MDISKNDQTFSTHSVWATKECLYTNKFFLNYLSWPGDWYDINQLEAKRRRMDSSMMM